MRSFHAQYRSEDGIIYDGWGDSRCARHIVVEALNKYNRVPLAQDKCNANVFPLYKHIFIPPPPRHYGKTHFLEDIAQVRNLYEKDKYNPKYGYIISGATLKNTIRASGHNIGRSRLRGHERTTLIDERLRIAVLLAKYDAKTFTASNDADWLTKAKEYGVIAAHVDHEDYDVENIAGISALDLWTIQYQRADSTYVAIVEHGIDEDALKDRLVRMGVSKICDAYRVFNVPDRLIPWEVPARGTQKNHSTNKLDRLRF